jgi:uncharacterized protein (DUF1800 family)
MRRLRSIAGLLGLATVFTGCGGSTPSVASPEAVLVGSSTSTVRAESSVQLTATVKGTLSSRVIWSVNGVPGGNPTVGTINASGLYTAPVSLPQEHTVGISAQVDTASGRTGLMLWNAIPVISSVRSEVYGDAIDLTVSGDKFLSGAIVNVGGTIYPAVVRSRTELKVTVPASLNSAANVELAVANPDPGAAFSESTLLSLNRPTRSARGSNSNWAARFLDQATFGPTAADVLALNQSRTTLGTTQQAMSQWIDTQMNASVTVPSTWPDTSIRPSLNGDNATFLCGTPVGCLQILWYQNALQGPDQLRQRTAFALSQIWVVSGNTVTPGDAYATYYKTLNDGAFGNYRDLMKNVTLTSGMGFYLDMGNSAKPVNGSIANENYARELLQLFTIGLYLLNDDGTFQLDAQGQRIASYTEDDVQEFARAFTGWTYKRNDNQVIWNQSFTSGNTDRKNPMVFSTANHDVSGKTLLNYSGAISPTLPAAQSPLADVDGALDNIFNHPNLPPFISQQLIQHLVTSNPSPAYVARISAVFKNNGNGVRGDLAAVIKAILLDPEARAGDAVLNNDTQGHLREPALYFTSTLRSLGFTSTGALNYTNNAGLSMTNFAAGFPARGSAMGQSVLIPVTVFNYFTPDYTIQNGTLLGPEFQLQTTAVAPLRLNYADSVSRNTVGFAVDVSAPLATLTTLAANPQALVDQLDQQFMYGQMSPSMKQTIISTITPMSNTFRARVALYLVLSSSQYQVVR